MENYDEKMNYSFEPSEYDDPSAARSRPEPQPARKQKKGTGKIVLLLIAVAIVAGIGGSVLTGAIRKLEDRNLAGQEAKEAMSQQEEEPSSDEEESGKPEEKKTRLVFTDLPETLPSNRGDKSLSPKEVYELNVNSVVGISTEITTNVWGQEASVPCSGSGFILTEDGYIMTNNHVVENANFIKVSMYDESEYDAVLVGGDSANDVALLKIEATGLKPVSVADMQDVTVGDEVVAIGNPLGELTFTMTHGYVSALDRAINTDGTPVNMLQTDAAINSGNSGGPLFDMNGNVVGITSAKYSGQTSSGAYIEGISFAIPIDDAVRIAYDLKDYGYVTGRAYLGVTVRTLDSTTASDYNLPVGPYVMTVTEGSCADKGGITTGDIITEFNGEKVETNADLIYALSGCHAGDRVTLKVFRAGAELEVSLTLDERPSDDEIDAAEAEANDQIQEEQGTEEKTPSIRTPDEDEEQPSIEKRQQEEEETRRQMEEFFRKYFGFGY